MRCMQVLILLCIVGSQLSELINAQEKKFHNVGVDKFLIQISNRVKGGTNAALGQFPYQVSLSRNKNNQAEHFCGGTILTSEWILTAAHCLISPNEIGKFIGPNDFVIYAGFVHYNDTNLLKNPMSVSEVIIHPEYKLPLFGYDLALVRMKIPFTFTENVTSIPITKRNVLSNTICEVSGWGASKSGGPQNMNLMYIEIPIVNQTICKEWLVNVSFYVPKTHLCAGDVLGAKDTCTGDSGSGLICNGYLTGVVSAGYGCGHPRLPGIYVDVFFFRSWLEKYIGVSINDESYNNASNIQMQAYYIFIAIGTLANFIFSFFMNQS